MLGVTLENPSGGNTGWMFYGVGESAPSANLQGDLALRYFDGASNAGEPVMNIDKGGDVLIGNQLLRSARTKLEVDGTLKIAYGNEACDADREGAIRFDSGANTFSFCADSGTGWESVSLGLGGAGAPDRGIQFNSGGNFAADANFTYTSAGDFIVGSYQIEDTGTGNEDYRMYFDVSTGAFRAGRAMEAQWNYTSSGSFSVAMGDRTIASGMRSVAMGGSSVASGDASFAMGSGAVASAGSSIAIGSGPTASGGTSVALGNNTIAAAPASTVMGIQTVASGRFSTAIGNAVTAGDGILDANDVAVDHSVGEGSMAVGLITFANRPAVHPTITGDESLGIFMGDQDGGVVLADANTMGLFGGSMVIDPKIPATNLSADTALEIDGTIKIAYGNEACDADREGAIRFDSGANTFSFCADSGTGWEAVSLGLGGAGAPDRGIQFNSGGNFAADANFTYTSAGDFIVGSSQINDTGSASNDSRMYFDASSSAFRAGFVDGAQWDYTSAGSFSAAFGYNNMVSADYGFAAGSINNVTGNYSAAFGSSHLVSGQYAMAMGSSNEATGDQSVAFGLDTLAEGLRSTAFGNYTFARGDQSTTMGNFTTASGFNSTAIGYDVTAGDGSGLTSTPATFADRNTPGLGNYSIAFGLGDAATANNPMVSGNRSMGVFFGQQDNTNVSAEQVLAIVGGNLVLRSGSGMNVAAAATQLDMDGTIKIAYGGEACDAAREGAIRFDSGANTFSFCADSGTGWESVALGLGGAGAPDRGIQFNSGGNFAASSNLVYTSAGRLGVGSNTPEAILDVVYNGNAEERTMWVSSSPTLSSSNPSIAGYENADFDTTVAINNRAVTGDVSGISNYTYAAALGGSGSVVNLYGIKSTLSSTEVAGGSVANAYGLYLENTVQAADSFVIYSSGGKNFFDGSVGIGQASPATKIDVDGTLKIAYGNESCDAAREGAIRFDSATNSFSFCADSGNDWEIVSLGSGVNEIDDLTDGRTGGFSVFLGNSAGLSDDLSDNYNVGIGELALSSSTTGYQNVAIGSFALADNTTGYSNIAIGANTLRYSSQGIFNVAIGRGSLANSTGSYNTGVGQQALTALTSGQNNVALGSYAGSRLTIGGNNTVLGVNALNENQTGSYNVAVGELAGQGNGIGNGDANLGVFLGYAAGQNVRNGADNNVIIGANAGTDVMFGSGNILLGAGVQLPTGYEDSYVNIGNVFYGSTVTGELFIGGTGALRLPSGDNTTRPGTLAGTTAINGMIRYNSTSGRFEGYQADSWQDILTGAAIGTLNDLTDVDTTGVSDQEVLTYDSASGTWVPAAVSTDFVGLTDTPATFSGQGGRFARVNSGETAIEFTDQIIETVTGEPAPNTIDLNDLGDVSASPTGGQALIYDSASGVWVAGTVGGGSVGAAGSDREIQFNSGGNMATDSGFVFTSAGLGIGTAVPSDFITIAGDNQDMSMYSYSTSGALSGADINFWRSRGTEGAPFSAVNSGDKIGGLRFYGSTNSNWVNAAQISVMTSATAGSWTSGTDRKADIVFETINGFGNYGERMRIHSDGTVRFISTGAIVLPVGTDAQRPTGEAGMLRYSSTSNTVEYFNGTIWESFATSAGSVSTAGAEGDLQFNSGGELGAVSGLNFNVASGTLSVDSIVNIGGTTGLAAPVGAVAAGAGGSGSTAFTGLSDTPVNYTGAAGQMVVVNSGATGLEFVDVADAGVWTDSGSGYIEYNSALGSMRVASVTGAAAPAGAVAVSNATSLVALTDTSISSVSSGQILTYDGSQWVNVDANSAGLWSSAGGDSIFYNSGSPTVGIGTATPSVELDVAGDINLTGMLMMGQIAGDAPTYMSAGSAVGALNDLTDVDTAGVVDGEVLMYSAGSGSWVTGVASGTGLWTDAGGYIEYNSSYGGMKVGSVASVSAPTGMSLNALSDVLAGSPSTNDVLSWNGTNWVPSASAGGGGGDSLWTAGSGDAIYYTSGSPTVGIGTASPAAELDVVGDIRVSNSIIIQPVSGLSAPTFISASGSSTALGGLADVDVSGVSDGQVLMYSAGSGNWVAGSGGGGGGAVNDLSDATTDYANANMFIGSGSGAGTTTAQNNTAVGYNALASNDVSNHATAFGAYAAENYDAANQWQAIVAVGTEAARYVTQGSGLTAIGNEALENFPGDRNTAVGSIAMFASNGGGGNDNVGVGDGAGSYMAGYNNVVVGQAAFQGGFSGDYDHGGDNNVFIGSRSARDVQGSTTSNNVMLGYQTGLSLRNGSSNIIIGANVDVSGANAANEMNIGNVIYGSGMYNAGAHIGINNSTPNAALDVTGDIEYTGTLTDVSDMRLKKDIAPLDANEIIGRLSQIDTYSFRMINDEKGQLELGVMAQEVEKVFPELVRTANDEMGTKSVNYVGFIAPLIEASKELKSENDALRAEITEMKLAQAEFKDDIMREVNGLKAHTGYGIDKAQIGLWTIALLFGFSSIFFMVGGILRHRQHKQG
ncbi:MAG TPA: hypothetical protein EYQ41_08700 [Micavibrio sp.]|nr:hypothetical protein [Micavibrio sp.]